MRTRRIDGVAEGGAERDTAASLWVIVTAMTVVQAYASLVALSLAAVAPRLAENFGVSSALIGYQVSLVYCGAVTTSLVGGDLVRRWGACRTSQISLVLCILGCAAATVPQLAVVALASVTIGFGYGLTNPAAAHLLNRVVGPRNRNFIFSLKQTGVPLGIVLAGAVMPPLTLLLGWRGAIGSVAAVGLIFCFALQPWRAEWDRDRDPSARLRVNPLRGLGLVWRLPPLRYLSFAAFTFACLQLCVTTFLVAFLVEETGMGLVRAGFLLSAVQVAGAAARLVWGWLADRTRSGTGVLLGLGLGMAAASAAAAFAPAWPLPAIQLTFLAFGMTAIGWNGVFLAEVARQSPPELVGTAIGASLAFTFAGVVFGPSAFALLLNLAGGYAVAFGSLAAVAATGAGLVLLARRAKRTATRGAVV